MQDIKFYDPYQLKIDLSLTCDLNQEGVSFDGEYLFRKDIPSEIGNIGPGVITIESRGQSFIAYGITFGPINDDEEYIAPDGTFPTPDETGGYEFHVYRSTIRYLIGNVDLFAYETAVVPPEHPDYYTTYYRAFCAQVGSSPIFDIAKYVPPSQGFDINAIMLDGEAGRFYAIMSPPGNEGHAGMLYDTYNMPDLKLAPYLATGSATPRAQPSEVKIYIDKPLDLRTIASYGSTVLHFFFFNNPCYRRVTVHSQAFPAQHLSIASLGKTCKIKQITYHYNEGSAWDEKLICPNIAIYGDDGAPVGQKLAILESRMDFSNGSYYIASRSPDYSGYDTYIFSTIILGKGSGNCLIEFTEKEEEQEEEGQGEEGQEGDEEGDEEGEEEEDTNTWLLERFDDDAQLLLRQDVFLIIDDIELYPIRERASRFVYPHVVLGPESYFAYQCTGTRLPTYPPLYGEYSVSVSAVDPEGNWNDMRGNMSAFAALDVTRVGGFAITANSWSGSTYTYIAGTLTCVESPEPDNTTMYAHPRNAFTPDQPEYYSPGLLISRLNDTLASVIADFRMEASQRYMRWKNVYESIPEHVTIDLEQIGGQGDHFVFSLYKSHSGDFFLCDVSDRLYEYHAIVYPWWALWVINSFSFLLANYEPNCQGVFFYLPAETGAYIPVPADDIIGREYYYGPSFYVKISE